MSRDLSTLIAIGKRAYDEKDYSMADKLLREAVDGGASYADIHYVLGLVNHRWGKLQQAVEQFEKALLINPDYTEALLSLSITLNDMGRYDEAKVVHRRAGDSVANAGEPSRESMYRGRIANLHAELGELYLASGKFEDAIEQYRKALSVAPGYPDLRVRLAVAFREAGRMAEGLEELREVLSAHPGNVQAMIQRGILHYLSGGIAEARGAWEEALYRDPTNKLIRLYLNTLDREAPPR